jgi:hypothetical protein
MEKMKMRPLGLLLLLLLAAFPVLAKPKTDVRVKVNDEVARDQAQDSLSKSPGASMSTTIYGTVSYANITVSSDNTEAVAKNNGQWCIRGDTELDSNTEYRGTLEGNTLKIDMVQKNGRTKTKSYEVIEHKSKKLSDLTRLLAPSPASADFYA